MALKTVDGWLTENSEIQEKLTAFGIPRNSDAKAERTLWNGKYHRKSMDSVINTIISILNRG